MMRGSNDLNRNAALATFNPAMKDLLHHPETFNYPFDSIKSLSKLTSPNGQVRIYTWALASRTEGTYTYYGLIQKLNPKTKQMKLIGLTERKYTTAEADTAFITTQTWYGALYYDIFEKKFNKNTCYFLLGWHGNDRFTTKKVIDVLHFDEFNTVTFGAPVFYDETQKVKNRVIFEFTSEAVMLLRYDRKKKMIVFDHLSPTSPQAKGQYRFYGPDFTYDGFRYKKGAWIYKTNLDLRNTGDSK